MDLQRKEEEKARDSFGWTFVLSIVVGLVGLMTCFWGEPNKYAWLILVGVAVAYCIAGLWPAVLYGEVISALRKECEGQKERRETAEKDLGLAKRYIREFPVQSDALKRLRAAGAAVRAAYAVKAELFVHGHDAEGPHGGSDNPTSVAQMQHLFDQARNRADLEIRVAEQRMRDLHECALACHPEDVYSQWTDYAWPEPPTS